MIPKDYKIDNRYSYIKSLGDGLSGQVMLVEDIEGKKALKFLKRVQLNVSREETLENFKREFSILKELNHPNIARILDFGFDRKIEKYFFTTEFVEGKDFEAACEDVPLEQKEKLIVQVLRALNYLHNRRIYHFDIKPQNILVAYENGVPVHAKIIDFGLAGFASPRKKVGTPAYMSPEVVQGGHLDGRADLYSLGVLIYSVLTGCNPFQADSLRETLKHQMHLVPTPPTQVGKQIPEYWDHIVMRLLEKNPVHRYSQASLVIRDLNYLSKKSFEIETGDTKLSYLPERGALIGREHEWKTFTDLFSQIFVEEKNATHLLVIAGEQGCGKSRMISEIKYFSQLRNVPVLSFRQYRAPGEKPSGFVLVADDDLSSEDEVNGLCQELSGRQCLLVWATEGKTGLKENATTIELKPYSKAQLKNYIESVTGLADAPQHFIDGIFVRTHGNPLFVTEFVKSLLKENLLFDESGKWDATTFEDLNIDFDRLQIPDSIEEYFSGHYQLLLPHEQDVLAWVAVNGDSLSLDDLKTLTGNADDLSKTVLELIAKSMLVKTSREHAYGLANPLMAGVITRFISDQERSSRHDALADLCRDHPNRECYFHHLTQGSRPAEQRRALLELGRIQTQKQNHAGAVSSYSRLHELLLPEFPSTDSVNAVREFSQALLAAGQYEKACEVLESAIDKLNICGMASVQNHFILYDLYFNALFKANRYEKVRVQLDRIQRENGALPNSAESLVLENYLGFLLFHEGKIAESESVFLKTHRVWQGLSLGDQERVTNNRIIDVYLFEGKLKEAVEICQESIRIFLRTGNRFKLASLHYALGDLYYRLLVSIPVTQKSDYSQLCLDEFLSCEKTAREIHHQQLLYSAFNGVGNLYYHRGDFAAALTHYQRALAVARSAHEFNLAAILSHNISNTHKKLGQWQDAYAHMVYTINTLESAAGKNAYLWTMLSSSYMELAELHLIKKDVEKTRQTLTHVEDLVARHDFLADQVFQFQLLQAKMHHLANEEFERDGALAKARESADSSGKTEELNAFEKSFKTVSSSQPAVAIKGVPMNTPSAPNALDDLERIIEINAMINAEHDLKTLFKMVLRYALELTGAELGFVLLIRQGADKIEGENSDPFEVSAAINASSSDEEKISMSIVRTAIESGEMVTSADAIQDERFDASQSVILNELKSILCLPILSQNRCVGVFYLDNHFKTNAFAGTNIMLLKAFCDQTGIAIANARLIRELNLAKEELEKKLTRTEEELAEVRQILGEEAGQYRSRYSYDNIIAQSKSMQDVFKLIDKVTQTNLSIFIQGESGTGKELIAKALHYNNTQRKEGRFVAVNCGAIPHNLMESELFGHKAGSFTGATRDKKGLFEEASGGTLFLDEIGELSLELQVKLLRVLQEGEVQRVGDVNVIKVNVRVVCASHRDIELMVQERKFREDLYYRLCQMKINLPPLRERLEDIPLLTKHFVKKYGQQNDIQGGLEVPADFMKALLEYAWPGNIRELENMVHVACALAEGNRLSLGNLPSHYGITRVEKPLKEAVSSRTAPVSGSPVRIDAQNPFDPAKTWRDYEALILAKSLAACGGKKKLVAEKLGLSPSTIYKKIEELKLESPDNPLHAESFAYDGESGMEAYVQKVFLASLAYHDNRPYSAIRQLGVSQGYFYKVMKAVRADQG